MPDFDSPYKEYRCGLIILRISYVKNKTRFFTVFNTSCITVNSVHYWEYMSKNNNGYVINNQVHLDLLVDLSFTS